MNQNYVRKCEEYLQNIPSQKLPPASTGGASRPNLSSRKLTQPGLRQGRQSINNAIPPPVLPPPPAEGSRPKPKPPPPSTPVPATGGRRTPCRPPTARPGQLGSKFIRPCCRPKGRNTAAERAGRRGSDNVNQNDVRVMDGTGAGGRDEGRATGKTKTWDGILTAESTVETTAVASLTQIKSKVSEGMSFFLHIEDIADLFHDSKSFSLKMDRGIFRKFLDYPQFCFKDLSRIQTNNHGSLHQSICHSVI